MEDSNQNLTQEIFKLTAPYDNIYQGKATVHFDDGTVTNLLFKNGKPVD